VIAFSTSTQTFTLGTVGVTVVPALDGRVDVYVPIVDWGVRAEPYEAPIAIELRFRALDREAAVATLRSGTVARASLRSTRDEVVALAKRALERAAVLGFAGGIIGGTLGGALVGAALHRRHWLAYGAAVGTAVPLVAGTALFFSLRGLDYSEFQQPTFYAHGRELPRLLTFSEQLLTAGESYTESYEQALAGLANLVAFASEGAPARPVTRSAIVASDLHANALVFPVLNGYAEGKTVFMPGDFTLLGTRPESRLVRGISRLGRRVVAVSGNHDSRPFMRDLARAGVVVLTRNGRLRPDGAVDGRRVVEIDGLTVAGYDDPLERTSRSIGSHPLELRPDELAEEAEAFVSWFTSLPERPDIVLVHQHALAHALLDVLAEDSGAPVLILTGHDHTQHLEQSGAGVLVDGGTVGAGGPFAIGVQPAGFADLHFTDQNEVEVVDLIEVEPLSGEARATREVLGAER
jgi:predicted phosphodiesterase